MRKFGPLAGDHPCVGQVCPACSVPFKEGDALTLVSLGPGSDPDERHKARVGRPYNAIAQPVHWACATGEE